MFACLAPLVGDFTVVVVCRLCNECTSVIENHEKIQVLSITHRNVAQTLEEIDNIIDLPSNASIAECMLDDDGLLLDAYKALSTLEGTSNLVQDAMQNNHEQIEEIQNINEYFDKARMNTLFQLRCHGDDIC